MGDKNKPDEFMELIELLDSNQIPIMEQTCEYFCGLSGSEDGLNFILSKEDLFIRVLKFCSHQNSNIWQPSMKIVINSLQIEKGIYFFVSCDKDYTVTHSLFSFILDDSQNASRIESSILLVENLTRISAGASFILTYLEKNKLLPKLINLLTSNKEVYHNLALIFGNVCQISNARKFFFDNDGFYFTKILSFLSHPKILCRLGSANLTKNCCFETNYHEWMLADDAIVASILLPLAGPEELTDEENESLPIDLQYLPEDKKREEDNDVRIALVEGLHKLCSTQIGRDCLRKYNVYVILRELDKATIEVPKNEALTVQIHNVIQILIGDDDQSCDNLNNLDVPQEIVSKLEASN